MSKFLRYFSIVFLLVFMCMVLSCHNESKESFIENFGSFILDLDSNAKKYSEVDWQNADEQFVEFKDSQLPMWESLMNSSEKEKVNIMIGKYQALQIKRGIKDLKNQFNDMIDQSKTMLNELSKDTSITQ